RRHTRWPRDWSSDVCSSDLFIFESLIRSEAHGRSSGQGAHRMIRMLTGGLAALVLAAAAIAPAQSYHRDQQKNQWKNLAIGAGEIGRASCRERGMSVGAVGH